MDDVKGRAWYEALKRQCASDLALRSAQSAALREVGATEEEIEVFFDGDDSESEAICWKYADAMMALDDSCAPCVLRRPETTAASNAFWRTAACESCKRLAVDLPAETDWHEDDVDMPDGDAREVLICAECWPAWLTKRNEEETT